MEIKWLRVVRDAVLIGLFYYAGSYILGKTVQATPLMFAIVGWSLGIIGFIAAGYWTPENRWKHLCFVAGGVWIIDIICVMSMVDVENGAILLGSVLGNAMGVFTRMAIGFIIARAITPKDTKGE